LPEEDSAKRLALGGGIKQQYKGGMGILRAPKEL